MSVKTKETSVYGCLISDQEPNRALLRLLEFSSFLGGAQRKFEHKVDTYAPVADTYWKRAHLVQTDRKSKLKMYADKVENHQGVTLKHCHAVEGPSTGNGFHQLVQGMGFQRRSQKIVKGTQIKFDCSTFADLKVAAGKMKSPVVKLKIFKTFENGVESRILD